MELQIRSQDKTRLSKINSIQYGEYQGAHYINGYCINEVDNIDLGIYATKERALEVLDEIQNLINPKYATVEVDKPFEGKIEMNVATFPMGQIVYKMPKE